MKLKLLLIAALTIVFTVSCKKKSEDTTEEGDSTETLATEAVSEASSHATATEGGGSSFVSAELNVLETELGFANQQFKDQMNSQNLDAINPKDKVNQMAVCAYSSRSCSSGTGTIDWNSCSVGTVTMTGGWTETWSDVGDCTLGYLSGIGNTVKRSSTGSVVNFPGGATITTDTAGGTAWDGTVFVAGKIITARGSTTNRSVAMDPVNTSAVHKVFKGRRGTTLFDYYAVPELTVTGARKNGTTTGLGSTSANRAMTGTVKIYHNLAKYTATNTFSGVTWSDSSCCYPTSGSITTSFTGTSSVTSMTTTFSTSCGNASVSINGETAKALSLSNCQ